MPHPGSDASGNDNRPNIVNVGQRRAGDRQIPQGGKKTIAVVGAQQRPGIQPGLLSAYQRIRGDEGARGILGAIDTVAVGRQRPDPRFSPQRAGQRQQKLAVSPASSRPLRAYGHRRFPSAQQHRRGPQRIAVILH